MKKFLAMIAFVLSFGAVSTNALALAVDVVLVIPRYVFSTLGDAGDFEFMPWTNAGPIC